MPNLDIVNDTFLNRLRSRWWFPVFRLKSYKLFMIRPDPDLTDRVGCDDEIVEVRRLTSAQFVSIELIYNDLLSLHNRQYSEDLINALWESNLTLERAYVDGDDVARILLNGELVASETCSVPRMAEQLRRPALQVRSGTGFVRRTEVTVNGVSLEDALRSL